jgi:hypothetical protein
MLMLMQVVVFLLLRWRWEAGEEEEDGVQPSEVLEDPLPPLRSPRG